MKSAGTTLYGVGMKCGVETTAKPAYDTGAHIIGLKDIQAIIERVFGIETVITELEHDEQTLKG